MGYVGLDPFLFWIQVKSGPYTNYLVLLILNKFVKINYMYWILLCLITSKVMFSIIFLIDTSFVTTFSNAIAHLWTWPYNLKPPFLIFSLIRVISRHGKTSQNLLTWPDLNLNFLTQSKKMGWLVTRPSFTGQPDLTHNSNCDLTHFLKKKIYGKFLICFYYFSN